MKPILLLLPLAFVACDSQIRREEVQPPTPPPAPTTAAKPANTPTPWKLQGTTLDKPGTKPDGHTALDRPPEKK